MGRSRWGRPTRGDTRWFCSYYFPPRTTLLPSPFFVLPLLPPPSILAPHLFFFFVTFFLSPFLSLPSPSSLSLLSSPIPIYLPRSSSLTFLKSCLSFFPSPFLFHPKPSLLSLLSTVSHLLIFPFLFRPAHSLFSFFLFRHLSFLSLLPSPFVL